MQKPKLVGSDRSRFVNFIKANLADTLERRFSPLIYFWGTNPQTALFGYLQGQTSADEMPRSNFYRQYLYVSDAQYLTSNVDLTQHYQAKTRTSPSSAGIPLELAPLELGKLDNQSTKRQLNENLRSVLESDTCWLGLAGRKLDKEQVVSSEVHKERNRSKRSDSAELSSGASSDSGVSLAGCRSSTSSSSSSSSLSDVTSSVGVNRGDCACKRAYHDHDHLSPFAEGHPRGRLDGSSAYLRREHLEFGQCALDWYTESHEQYHKNRLVALISAGMTTGSDKKYVTDTVKTLAQLGYEVCVFIRRGVGGLKLTTDKFFSPAKWRDFEAAVLSVRRQRPDARLVAVGFSFGSIELCRYLSMSGPQSAVHAALLISCPFDPEAGGRNMRKRPLNRRIDAYLAKNLGKQLHQALEPELAGQQLQQNYNGSLVNLAKLPKVRSLVDFEHNYNRAIQNYPSVEAYAADSRLQDHLARIETPTLCLSSEDDFMAPVNLLPLDQIRANSNLCMVLTKCGGHMAFIDGLLWPKRPYFAQRIVAAYMGAVKSAAEGLSSEPQIGLIGRLESDRKLAAGRHHLIQMLGKQ